MSVDYSTSNNNANKNTTTIVTATKPINSANYSNSSTTQFVSYNRLNSNHKKFTPIVHGFKLDNISESKSSQPSSATTTTQISTMKLSGNKISDVNEQKKVEAPIIPIKPAFLRSTSAGDINRKMKFSTTQSSPSPPPSSEDSQHFSQTLRRTGQLDRILSNDQRTESIFGKVIATAPSHNHQQQTMTSIDDDERVKVKLRQSSASVPPPPALTFRKSAPAGEMLIEPRNQLLDAIKNFNKDSLRRK